MAKSLYITSVHTFSGKTALALGLGLRMQAAGLKVGYLKPVSTQPYKAGGRVLDEDADFVRRTLGLETPPWELSPVVITNEVLGEIIDGTLERDLLGDVEEAVKMATEENDIVLLEGGASMREGYAVGLNTLSVVEKLCVPALTVLSFSEGCVSGMCIIDDALAAQKRLGDGLLGVVINSVPREHLALVREKLVPYLEKQGIKVFGVLQHDPFLRALSVGEVIDTLNAKVLTGAHLRERLIEHMSVGAMTVEAALPRFRRQLNKAVFTGGDRTDIQAAALETSTTALVLTGNLQPSSTILKRAEELGVAVLLVPDNTLEA
ncbi:MAG: phosphotransacetylase family protein, partial [Chloroflexi bacterium]